MEPRNRFQGINSASLCGLADRYDNITPRFLAPIDSLKIPAQFWKLTGCREGRLTCIVGGVIGRNKVQIRQLGQSTSTTLLWFSYNTYPHTPAPFPLSYFPPPRRPKARSLTGASVLYCWTGAEGSNNCDFHCDVTVVTVCVAGDAKSRASIAVPAVVI